VLQLVLTYVMFWGYSSVGGLKLCPLKTYLIIMGYRSKSALSTGLVN
jgi:hypothetical protein